MTTMTIRQELAAATRITKADDEQDFVYRERLVKGYARLNKAEVGALSEEAYQFAEAGVRLLLRRKAGEEVGHVAGFPDEEKAGEPKTPAAEEPAQTPEKASPPAEKPSPEKKPAASTGGNGKKSAAKRAPKSKRAPRPKKLVKDLSGNAVDRHSAFRRLVLHNYGLDRQALIDLGEQSKVGLTRQTMGAVHYHTMQTVEMLAEIYGFEIPLGVPPEEVVKDGRGVLDALDEIDAGVAQPPGQLDVSAEILPPVLTPTVPPPPTPAPLVPAEDPLG